ncbi:hypothetical protein [Domibacillus sp. A3M-37]|nr:hypothetical protein [Domibacillus sp. A3M-37]
MKPKIIQERLSHKIVTEKDDAGGSVFFAASIQRVEGFVHA